MERNCLSSFGRGLHKEHSCETILKSDHWFSRRSYLKLFYLFIALAAICSTKRNGLSNFGKGSPREHACLTTTGQGEEVV